MRILLMVVTAIALAACGGDDTSAPSDPTIVSAVGACELEANTGYVVVNVEATDPAGAANLAGCSGTIDTFTAQDDMFADGCSLLFTDKSCVVGDSVTVALKVTNATGGEATSSQTLVLQQ